MLFAERRRMEPILEQVPASPREPIEDYGPPGVYTPEKAAETLQRRRGQQPMNMVLHEAIPMHLHIFFSGDLREAFQIFAFVEAMPKEFGSVYTARNNMMGDTF